MPAYRFCRPDDVPRLVRAVNECFLVHFPGAGPATVEGFRAEMKELDVWPSSSMVALAGDEPIAVVIGTRRAGEVLVLRIGVRPDHLRQGHGSHLLTSLSQKLAVLGPPRLVAEVPLDLPGVAEFFAAVGYEREADYVDWTRPPGDVEPVPEELTMPITVAELVDQDLLEVGDGVAWERARETLMNRKDVLDGLAIASPEQVEAWVLFRETAKAVDVVASGCRDRTREELFLGLLVRSLIGRAESAVRVPKLAEDEMPSVVLEALGFAAGRRYARLTAVATST